MNIRALRRHLPSQGTERSEKLADKLLRGDKLQGELRGQAMEQLTTVPEPWLERLEGEGLAYVALGYHDDLSQTDLITSYDPDRLRIEAKEARKLSSKVQVDVENELKADLEAETDDFRRHMLERGKVDLLKERLAAELDAHNLGFAIRVTRDLTPLQFIEGENGIVAGQFDDYGPPSETERDLFREVLLELNGQEAVADAGSDPKGYHLADDATLEPANDILLIPYKMYGKKRLSEVSKASYSSINGMLMDQHMGAHYWPNRLIVMDDEVAVLPSTKTGNHSVLLHETGHAIDYIAEKIDGQNHRETIDRMYKEDMELAKSGDDRFLTDRARDNAREYFAEAVEAYLTQPVEDEAWYKQENHYVALQEGNPRLYEYVDTLMKLPAIAKDQ
jgi:hypothetical protein